MKPIRVETTSKTRDDLVYKYEEGKYWLYKVLEIEGDMLRCVELNTIEKSFSRHLSLDFGLVGVFENLGKKTTRNTLKMAEVSGKLFSYKGLVMTIPLNILCET